MEGYHVENFGCRANRADGEAIAAELRVAGFREAEDSSGAGVVVLNTCAVTEEAERSARSYLRRVLRTRPDTKVIVTGCYAQRAPEAVAALEGVTAVVGNSHKALLVKGLLPVRETKPDPMASAFVPVGTLLDGGIRRQRPETNVRHDPLFAHSELASLPFIPDAHQTRPNLKIQDGCGNRCSFCIIPVTRGPSRSVTLTEALRAVEEFVSSGGQELVLSGINLGRWGRDFSPARRFEEMVAAILDRSELPRLRISSVEPMDWSAELIALFRRYGQDSGRGPRLARHAHLPLQSGSDAILRAMHRRYRPWHYAAKVEEIRRAMPDAAIGADVMIGFPGETETLFRETYDFIDKLPFTYLHVFPFSARPGTAAFALHQSAPVHGEAVKERKAALRGLILAKNEAFRGRFLGSELSVVTLAGGAAGATEALSDNFLRVSVAADYSSNRLLRLRATALTVDGLSGEAVSESACYA